MGRGGEGDGEMVDSEEMGEDREEEKRAAEAVFPVLICWACDDDE